METKFKPQELRIGNLINDTNDFTMQVVGLFKDEVLLDFEGNQGDVFVYTGKELEVLKPIPITEEYLIRLGFQRKSRGKDFVWVHDYYMFSNVKSGWYFDFRFDGLINFCFGKLFVKEFRFVHQLQNFYFDMTGDEITFK